MIKCFRQFWIVALAMGAALFCAQSAVAGSGTAGDPFTSLSEAYGASSGRYHFNTGSGLFQADVDNSEGGGWVLVLQYVHAGGTNPALSVTGAGADLPVTSAAALGADESGITTNWGHAGNAAMSQFTGDIELRWYGETNGHARKIHFRSSIGDDYVRTGAGSFSGINSGFTTLTNHTANIPADAPNFYINKTDYAMTNFPFWKSSTYHWGVRGHSNAAGDNGNRWEVDNSGTVSTLDTINRVWVRDVSTNYTVTTTVDSGAGSLRAAIDAANASSTLDNITFAIPGAGPHVISPLTALPNISDDNVSIDGTSQNGTVCNTLVNGTPHVLNIQIDGASSTDAEGFFVNADNVALSGLSITGFDSRAIRISGPSNNGSIDCTYLGVNPDGVTKNGNARGDSIGSVLVLAGDGAIVTRSVISGNDEGNDTGVYIAGETVVLTGNIIGLTADGSTALGNGNHGFNIRPAATNVTIGGVSSSDRNIISGNGGSGLYINGTSTAVVLGNYIGTDVTGLIDQGNGDNGITADFNANDLTIGGTTAGARNVISGNTLDGISLNTVSNITILGNYIGLGADGSTDVGNLTRGMRATGTTGLSIGDGTANGRNIISSNGSEGINLTGGAVAAIDGNYFGVASNGTTNRGNRSANIIVQNSSTALIRNNIIAYTETNDGIEIQLGASKAAIIGNSIYGNFEQGIEIDDDSNSSEGVNLNDAGDADTGANEFLNFPVINAVPATGSTSVGYSVTLDVPANSDGYRIEFFRNTTADTNSYGEGETFLGFVDTGNHPGGAIDFDGTFTASVAVSSGDIISATATRKTGALSYDITSEFAENKIAQSALVVTNTNDSGAGSLRDAMTFANANIAEDLITFAIPGTGPHTITLASSLPTITDDGVSLDGTTQSGAVCGSLGVGTPHTLMIEIDANDESTTTIAADTVTIKGLAIGNSTSKGLFANVSVDQLRVECSYYGVRADGVTAWPLGTGFISAVNQLVSPTNLVIDNTLFSASTDSGDTTLVMTGVDGLTLTGSVIGLNASSSGSFTNGANGVYISSSSNLTIGGAAPAERVIISGHSGYGLRVLSASDVSLQEVYVGVGVDGTTSLGNGDYGINFANVTDATISDSIIANNADDGVRITNTSEVAVTATSIYNNGETGLDLDDNGVTVNDSGDSDTGANDRLNYPLINTISASGSTTVGYSVTLDVPANTEGYRIEFYKNSSPDATNGEGEIFLGFVDTGNHPGGAVAFDGTFTASEAVSSGDSLSATTTRKTGALAYDITSEFAVNKTAQSSLAVTNINDSGAGSLRDAITFANANIAEDAITFAIPGTGPHTITLATALPNLTDDGVSLDGTTQTGASCGDLWGGTPHTIQIQLNGVDRSFIGLTASADSHVIKGLSLTGFSTGFFSDSTSSNVVLQCNYLGLLADGTAEANTNGAAIDGASPLVGGLTAGQGNVVSGNTNSGIIPGGSVTALAIRGNFVGTDPTGLSARRNGVMGIPQSVGVATWSDVTNNLISGNSSHAIHINNGDSVTPSGTVITVTGNYIGTDRTGNTVLANGGLGIYFGGSSVTGVVIGGATVADRNVISGNGTLVPTYPNGIEVRNLGGSVVIQGNYIGVGADGVTPIANVGAGIEAENALDVTIFDNVIAHNGEDGIVVLTGASQVAIYSNSIHSNTQIGIDLNDDEVTANDSGDGDTGVNDLLNYPLLNFVSASGTTFSYDLDLDVPANTDGYRIEFFANSAPDATNGEGEILLGFFDTGNHAGGTVTYNGSLTANQAVSVGTIISATTTRKTATSYDITSEFSVNKAVTSSLVVTNTNDSGAGSLRDAIIFANANAAEDDIIFAIPGAGPHVITLASGLPSITDDGITIDGTTQGGASCGDLWAGTPHTLQVSLSMGGLGGFDALTITGDDVSIKGLSIVGDGGGLTGVWFPAGTQNGSITCSYLGLNPDGTANALATGVAARGTNITIGGNGTGDGNVISSSQNGIFLDDGAFVTTIEGNFIGTDPLGVTARPNTGSGVIVNLGATVTVDEIRHNLISGNLSSGIDVPNGTTMSALSGDVVIAGNYIGVDRTGNTALANGGSGIEFGTGSISGVTLGGITTADRNIISGNGASGVKIDGVSDITILGNYIGLGADGTTLVGNSARGIQMTDAIDVIIGNGVASGRNVLSGNGSAEIWVQTSDNIQVDGNYFGTDLTGNISLSIESGDFINVYTVDTMSITENVFAQTNQEAIEFWTTYTGTDITIQGNKFGVGADGITAFSTGRANYGLILFGSGYNASGITIGGTGVGEGNLIANGIGPGIMVRSDAGIVTGDIVGNIIRDNGQSGIAQFDADSRLAVYANAIYNNGGLGIDLGTDGVTANDNNDVDSGPNDLLNFPVINSFSGASTTLSYDVDLNVPAGDYRIDFYKNTTADPTGYGEGETHLGFIELTHAGGTQTHTGNFTGLDSVDQGEAVTATTTRKTGPGAYDITSEFSLNYTSDAATELTASKSVDVFDPTSAGLYALPGNDIISSMTVTNVGNSAADTDSIVIIDAVPGEMTFYNGDMDDGGPATGPVYFTQTGGANLTFNSAADAAFSNGPTRPANMAGCTYTPSAGYDANVTYVCFNPKGAMSSGNPDPTFTVQFRARIK